jgi:hypothetical protein
VLASELPATEVDAGAALAVGTVKVGIGDTDHDESDFLEPLVGIRVLLLGLVTPAEGGPLVCVVVAVIVIVVVVAVAVVPSATAVSELELVVKMLTLAPFP